MSGGSTCGTDSSCRTRSSSLMAMAFCLQRLAQLLPRGEEARFHRFFRNAKDVGDFVVGEMHEVSKDDDGAVVRIEIHDRFVKMLPLFELFELLSRIRSRMRERIVERFVRAASLEMVDRFIDRDPVNPTEKLSLPVVTAQVLERLH